MVSTNKCEFSLPKLFAYCPFGFVINYSLAMLLLYFSISDAAFVVVSDDVAWCKENLVDPEGHLHITFSQDYFTENQV